MILYLTNAFGNSLGWPRVADPVIEADLIEQVKVAAFAEPTYGYRRLWRVVKAQGRWIGRERVRQLWRDLGLSQAVIRKPRRASPAIRVESEWPEGRRVQIDATR